MRVTPEALMCVVGLAFVGVLGWMLLRGSGLTSRQRAEADTLVRLLRHVRDDLNPDTASAITGVIARRWEPKVWEEVQRQAGAQAETAG